MEIVAFRQRVTFKQFGSIPFVCMYLSICCARREKEDMPALIANGWTDLHASLADVMNAVTPMSAARCRALHDCVVASNRISRLVNKRRTSARGPEYSKKLVGVCSLKIADPFGIIERIEHDNRYSMMLFVPSGKPFGERGFTALRHSENQAMAHASRTSVGPCNLVCSSRYCVIANLR